MEVINRPPVAQTSVAETLQFIWHPHPIIPTAGREIRDITIQPGSTVREICLAAGIDAGQPITINLDDRRLTDAEWDTVCPQPGQMLSVQAAVADGGGDGGSNPLQVVLLVSVIALSIAAPYLAPAAWGTIGAAGGVTMVGAMLSAAVGIAGAMIVNAVFSAGYNSPNMATNNGANSQASPTYSLSGGNNRMRQFEPMPVVMGSHRFFPDLGAKPYTEYVGDDQYLYQIYHLGLSNLTTSDWKIGTTPITSYADYEWHYPNAQGQLTAFPGNVDSQSGASLTQEAGWITRTTSSNTYKIGLDILGSLYYANDQGGLDATSVSLSIEYKLTTESTWTSGGTHTLSGNSQTPIRKSIVIAVPPGTYDVRVKRNTADSTDTRLQNKTQFDVLRSYQLDTADYTGQNRVGLVIRASEQLNGVIQQLSCHASALCHYYNGSAWVTAPSSNPAHWFMHFSRGHYAPNGKLLYGAVLPDSRLDLPGLVAWANFCAIENLTFNAVLDGTQTCIDVLTLIARCGFASPSWGTGKLGVVWDGRNQPAVDAYGMSNIIKGSFEVSYITEQLAEEIVVRFTNQDKDWSQDEVRVLVPGITTPKRTSTIDLFGCTSEAMAGKFANYVAAQQKYRRRRVSWDTDFQGFSCTRGDVVVLSHDLTQWGYSGRVVSINGYEVKIDRTVPRNGNQEFLLLTRPDGSMDTYTVRASATESDSLVLTEPVVLQPDCLPMDHTWMFSPMPTPGKKVKIVSVQPVSESRIKIVATDEYPEFYDAWDGIWNAAPKQTLLLNSTPEVSRIAINEMVYRGADNNVLSRVSVAFQAKNFERGNVRYKIGDGAWVRLTVYTSAFEFNTEQTGNLTVEITPINGAFSGKPVVGYASIQGLQSTQPPPDITSIIALYNNAIGGQTVLNWQAVEDFRQPDILYEVRLGDTWTTSKVLGRTPLTQFVAQGDGTYWVAAVHLKSGTAIYSASPTSASIVGATLQNNVLAIFDESNTGWSGTRTGGAVINNNTLMLASSAGQVTSSSGSYTMPASHIINAGRVCPCNVSITVGAGAVKVGDNILAVDNVLALQDLLNDELGTKVTVLPQIALGDDTGNYGSWQNFLPGYYKARYFKARLLFSTSDLTITPVIADFVMTVDVPDRVDTGQIITAEAGSAVTYTAPFNGGATGLTVPAVQLTIVNAQAGDDVVLSNQTLAGFTVRVTNAGVGVSRAVNWLSQGY